MQWRVELHNFLVRRYPDPRSLWQLLDLRIGPELTSQLRPELSAQGLAHEVILRAEARGQTLELLTAMQADVGERANELDPIIDEYLAQHEDPALKAAEAAYAEHARRLARRPPLEALVGRLIDVPDFDLEQVFLPPTARPVIRPLPQREREVAVEDPPMAPAEGMSSVTELWPARAPWLVLLGDPGAGKSVLTRWLTVEGLRAQGQVPVRIELRSYAAWAAGRITRRDFLSFLSDTHKEQLVPLSGPQLRWLALAGRLAWLIDGLDEISDAALRHECAMQIANLRLQGGQALITSRPRGVTRELDFLRDAGLAIYELCPLDDRQLEQLGQRWRDAGLLDDHALQRIRDASSARELMRNPLIATLLLVLARGGALPRQRQRLLAEICALTVRRWAEHRRPLALDAAGRMAFLRHLAWTMLTEVEHGGENIIERRRLVQVAVAFFRGRERLARDEAEARAEQLVEELNADVHALTPLGGGSFGFVHRSLLEFFAADALAEGDDGAYQHQFAADWQRGTWGEVLAMTCGLLAAREPQLAVKALRGVFAGCVALDSTRLLAASEFAVRSLAEIEILGRPFESLCMMITELWIELAGDGNLDPRKLAAALRTIGPRWPGAARLWAWVRATNGHVMRYGIPDYNPQFSSGGLLLTPFAELALAVAPVEVRREFLAILVESPIFLPQFEVALAAMGPWSELESAILARSLGQHGWRWDTIAIGWLPALAGSDAEERLREILSRPHEDANVRMNAAALLLASDASRAEAASLLDTIAEEVGQRPDIEWALEDVKARIITVLMRLEKSAALTVGRLLVAARSSTLRASACLVLAGNEDDEGASLLVEMLGSTDRSANFAANSVLAQGAFPDGVDRVLALLDGNYAGLTSVWAVSCCARIAELRGRWAIAETLWCRLAEMAGGTLCWSATAALMRRPAWRTLGLERLDRFEPLLPPNSPNIDAPLRRLAEYADGPERLRTLLQTERGRVRRRWIAQVLLEYVPGDTQARDELRMQAETSEERQEQYLLAHLMRRVGLPRADWEQVARKVGSHGFDPISRCASAILLGDSDVMSELAAATRTGEVDETGTWARGPASGVGEFAGVLLRCEKLRLQLAQPS